MLKLDRKPLTILRIPQKLIKLTDLPKAYEIWLLMMRYTRIESFSIQICIIGKTG